MTGTIQADDFYTTLLERGQAFADGTAEQCEAWRKWIRSVARRDKVKIRTGRCIYLTRDGQHRAWAITPERPHGSATEAEIKARHDRTLNALNRLLSGEEPLAPHELPFPWVLADWETAGEEVEPF
jgi:hypothetical protein